MIAGPLTGVDGSSVLAAIYLLDGRQIIVASRNGVITKLGVSTNSLNWKRVMSKRQIGPTRVVSAVFSLDRKFVLFGSNQGTIRVWSVDTGKQDGKPLGGHSGYISCLSFSLDGKYLASGSKDMTIWIWDMNKREAKIGPLRKHTKKVTAVNFSPSGNNVVSGSENKSIYIRDAFTGEVLRNINCVNGVNSVTYSPYSSKGLFILAEGYRWMSMWKEGNVTAPSEVFQVDDIVLRASLAPDNNRFVSVSGY